MKFKWYSFEISFNSLIRNIFPVFSLEGIWQKKMDIEDQSSCKRFQENKDVRRHIESHTSPIY